MSLSAIIGKLNISGRAVRALVQRLSKTSASKAPRRRAFEPHVDLDDTARIERLGTPYGGWSFVEDKRLYGSTIISCGLGEDASFDVEFASRYKARVIIVDPTARAVQHFDSIMRRVGMARQKDYVSGGHQPSESYDLAKIDKHSLHLVPKALWIHNDKIQFYAPPDPTSVSHSITDLHNSYSRMGPSCEVDCITIDRLMKTFDMGTAPALLKLDIEGAETDVMKDMLNKEIYPSQILIEFEEFESASAPGRKKVEEIDRMLRERNYRLMIFHPPCNFSYMRMD